MEIPAETANPFKSFSEQTEYLCCTCVDVQNFILQPVLTQHQLHHHFIAVKDFWDKFGQDKSPAALSTRYISGPNGFQRQG